MSPRALFPGSSVVEQPAVNRLVAGSNPARGARTIKDLGRITAAQKDGFFVLATLLATSGRIRELRTRHGPLLFGRLRPVAPGCGMRRPRLSPRGEPPLPRFGSHAEPGFYSSRPSSAVRPDATEYARHGSVHIAEPNAGLCQLGPQDFLAEFDSSRGPGFESKLFSITAPRLFSITSPRLGTVLAANHFSFRVPQTEVSAMANSIAKLAIAGATALTLALGSTGSANAWGGHGGHWGGGWGGWGVGAGILGGLALGTALSAPYWGGYGLPGTTRHAMRVRPCADCCRPA